MCDASRGQLLNSLAGERPLRPFVAEGGRSTALPNPQARSGFAGRPLPDPPSYHLSHRDPSPHAPPANAPLLPTRTQAAKKARILALISELEQHNAQPAPTSDLDLVQGDWRLMYSTITITVSRGPGTSGR